MISPRARPSLPALALLALLAAACGPGEEADGAAASDPGATRTDARVSAGAPRGHPSDPTTWPIYGGDPGQTRYSPLDEVHVGNVAGLEPAWRYRTGVAGVFEATPVVAGGGLFLTTPVVGGVQRVVRLDPATGDRIWERRIRVGGGPAHPTPANRGAAWLDGRLYVATLDARLLALDAASGDPLWEVRTADPSAGYQHKQAPLAWEGRVYLGVSASPFGIRGFVKAFDAASGEALWTWHSIPSPGEGGWWGEWRESAPGTGLDLRRDIAAERADSARYADAWRRGGGAVWMTPTLDAERGLLFVAVGNPAPELVGSARPGDNLWTVGVCALRAATGERAWCRQYLPHDVWGLDAASPPILFDLRRGGADAGAAIPAVGHFSKLGIFYAWHRETGEPLVTSEPYVPHENVLRPPSPEGVRMAPGIYGGTEWSPGAFHPGTGWLYAANVHWPGVYRARPGGGAGFDLAPASESWGNVVAVDPAMGRTAWEARTPRPMVGGVLVTAGGLVFAGRLDGGMTAWDAATGEELWTGAVEAGCASAPMTYRAGGRQFVVLACGGHFLGGGRDDLVVAFALREGS